MVTRLDPSPILEDTEHEPAIRDLAKRIARLGHLRLVNMIRTWHSTVAERGDNFACDGCVDDPDDVLFRAIDIAAPPAVVFRWLCQLRVAPYSYDWLDNRGRTSPRELTHGLDRLELGQRVMSIFKLVAFEPDHHMTLRLDRARNVFGDLAVTYRVTPQGQGSRLVVKLVIRRPLGPLRWFAPMLPLGDLVMMRKQLRTLKQHAERSLAS